MASKNDMSTKTSTVPQDREPMPSFIKALSFAQTDFDEDIINNTFSNISAGIVLKTKSENLAEDDECSPIMVVESFGDHSGGKNNQKDLSFGKKNQ